MVERLWNGHELDLADELFGPDFDSGRGRPPGPETVKEWHRSTRESFPDLSYEIDEILVQGNRVALRWTATGTQQGRFGPIPPTGKTATYAGAHFLTVEGGRITDLWSINDTFGKVLQLGAELKPPSGTQV
jgi:predicted ester cyclase